MPRASDISARRVHAILAAAVDDPRVLERLRRRSALPGSKRRGAIDLDFRRLRLFCGLTVKVRQNDVRLSLPLTFRLLDALKIGIEFFASYARQAADLRKRNKKTRAEKIQSIAAFLDGWLDRDDAGHALVRDMIRHERALVGLRQKMSVRAPEPGSSPREKRVAPGSVLRRSEGAVHHEMSCDVIALARELRARVCDLAAVSRGRFHYVHRWDALRGCVSADQVDELGFVLVDLANGRRSLARIAALLRQAGVDVAAADLCGAAQALVDNDILRLRT
jgi:hypothetical protein